MEGMVSGHRHICHLQPPILFSKAFGLTLVMAVQENPLVVLRCYTRAAKAWRVSTCQEGLDCGRVAQELFAFCDSARSVSELENNSPGLERDKDKEEEQN